MIKSFINNVIWICCKAICWLVIPITSLLGNIWSPATAFVVCRAIRGKIYGLALSADGLRLDDVTIDNHSNFKLGSAIKLYQGSVFSMGRRGEITIGDGTHVGFNCVFAAGGGKITIGEGVAISSNVTIYTTSNEPSSDMPIIRSIYKADVLIGNNVLIGMGVCILPGVCIGENASIGAGAVILSDVAAGVTVGGVPARVLC